VTKSELIAILAARYPQLSVRDTDLAVKTVLDAMVQALAEGQRIEIRGFGSFSLSERAPRVGRNPKSGEQVMVPGKQVPHFKAGKELRERVDATADDDSVDEVAFDVDTIEAEATATDRFAPSKRASA